jgi:hypothetical protein
LEDPSESKLRRWYSLLRCNLMLQPSKEKNVKSPINTVKALLLIKKGTRKGGGGPAHATHQSIHKLQVDIEILTLELWHIFSHIPFWNIRFFLEFEEPTSKRAFAVTMKNGQTEKKKQKRGFSFLKKRTGRETNSRISDHRNIKLITSFQNFPSLILH